MSEQKTEIRPLNGLRGIAALSVALGHYHISSLLPVLSIFYWKNAAVDLFFCLSGFTMCLAYRVGASRRLSFGSYLVARIARIYPLYLLTLIAVSFIINAPAIITSNDYQVVLWDYIRQMTMTNAWSFISSGMHWNFPAWSVSVEFFCYLFVFPVLFVLSHWAYARPWHSRLIGPPLLMAASYYVFATFYDQLVIKEGRNPDAGIPEIAFSVNLIRGILGFTAGWLIYASFLTRDRLWHWVSRHIELIALAVLSLLILGVLGILPVQLMILGFPLLILGVSSSESLTAKFLSWGPIHYLGNISYSIYLIHIPWYLFGYIRARIFDGAPTLRLSSSIVLVGGLIGLASLSYHFVEMPLRRWIRTAWQTGAQSAPRPVTLRPTVSRWSVVLLVLTLGGVEAARVGIFNPPPPLYVTPGQELTVYPTFEMIAGRGWSQREDWGIWSVGEEARLTIPVPRPTPPNLRLLIKGSFFLVDKHPSVTARVTVNDVEIGVFKPDLANNAIDVSLPVPAEVVRASGRVLRFKLSIDHPASPQSLGVSEDTRVLGFGLKSLKLADDKPS